MVCHKDCGLVMAACCGETVASTLDSCCVKPGASVLDLCCGSKMPYFDKDDPEALSCDARRFTTALCDGQALPAPAARTGAER